MKRVIWRLAFVPILLALTEPAGHGQTTTERASKSGKRILTTIDYSWTQHAQAKVEKNYNGAWVYRKTTPGDSIVVHLFRSDAVIGPTDEAGSYKITFQIPADSKPGHTIELRPIPRLRWAGEVDATVRVADMKDGEIVASKYGNPLLGWMKRTKVASVDILAVDETKVVIHLRLQADLDKYWDFDIDDDFTLRRK